MAPKHPNQVKIEQAIEAQGGMMSFDYLIASVNDGRMQSFSEGDSVLVTEIQDHPNMRVLHVVAAVGTLEEILALEPRFEAFAREQGCSKITAGGRSGWGRVATEGWNPLYTVYGKDL